MTDQRSRPHVILGVAGGIAAYKACSLLRLFTESGHDVRVAPTHSALQFVGAATWEALSGHRVASDVWTDAHEVPHVQLGRQADLVFVAPATANTLAKAAHGIADDLLTNILLTARCPIVMAPAMHTEMWEHAATQANVQTLRDRGVIVLEPAVGRLTGADTGKGRLPEPEALFDVAQQVLSGHAKNDLAGRHVVVTAGGTREYRDPVRFMSNRSSGKQGYALAFTAAARGAKVTLVSANPTLPDPAGVDVVRVVSAVDLHEATRSAARGADAVVMAAAVADYRPTFVADSKLKKSDDESAPVPPVELERNPDVLVDLVTHREPGQIIVGFAAETGDAAGGVLDHGRAKLTRKGCDLLVVNDVGPGGAFEADDNAATVLGLDGSSTTIDRASKHTVANQVWDLVAQRWA